MKPLFFQRNRFNFLKSIDGSVAVFTAYVQLQQSNDMAAKFVQESNFWWLTGINEPGWRLIMTDEKSVLVAPFVSDIHKTFDGSLSFEQAKKISGVDEVIDTEAAQEVLQQLAWDNESVSTIGKHPHEKFYSFTLNPAQANLRRELKKLFVETKDVRLELAKLRAIKQPEEIAAIKKAVVLTIEAFEAVKKKLPSLKYEYEVEAEYSYLFRKSGSKGHAYEPIVAHGGNACTLHYIDNQNELKKDQLLLLDIGAQVDGYAADITRTYQVGKATERQKQVHAAVESAHRQIIALLKPGLSVVEYHEKVDAIMKEKLQDLGLLNKPDDYRKYFPHAISHGLGIDVHDSLGQPTAFQEGMVLTVEPGIYIPEEKIGVRIEDDILITKDGHENLSAALATAL